MTTLFYTLKKLTLPLLLCSFVSISAQGIGVAKQGSLLYQFPATIPPPEWKGYGALTNEDGIWTIAEQESDHHSAAPKMMTPSQNLVAEFEFRVLTAKTLAFRFDVKSGHLCAFTLSPADDSGNNGKLVLSMLDYDREKGPAKIEWLDTRKTNIKPNDWLKVRLEIIDDEIIVRVADQIMYGKNQALQLTKTTIAFGVTQGKAQVRNLKIYAATPNPEWPKQRDLVLKHVIKPSSKENK
jgi:hypothetical protein